ncbi:MAG TPA: acyl-ACP--UDP-N-acetylglucosamine O-acyltransferase [bacterium]|nr:acyl-ACP--UDP-N-acetylglucosamine O-acyltransferase [bacterium]
MASPQVHPTAVVDRSAELDPGVVVGPFAVIGPRVRIGEGTQLGPHVVIEPDVTIGRDNQLGPGVVIGCRPQHRAYRGERSYVRIGDRNIFGEYATVSRGYGEGTATEIGDDCYVMSYVRVDHNCRLGSRVILTSGAGLGGFVEVADQAYVGGNSGVHQFVRIGRLGMVGAVSMVRQDVPPYVLVAGVPARAHALNVVGLERAGVAPEHRRALRRAFTLLFRSRLLVGRALERMEAELASDPFVAEMIAFIRSGNHERGIVRWAGETSSD